VPSPFPFGYVIRPCSCHAMIKRKAGLGNWVPGDMMFGRLVRDRARFRALVKLAADLGYTYVPPLCPR
jgi:hypothetical protein